MPTFKVSHPQQAIYSPIPLRAPLPVEDSNEKASQIVEATLLERSNELKSFSRGRLLRLELFVLAGMIGFGYFAWRTLKQESVFHDVSRSQTLSLMNLASSVAKSNATVNGLTKSVEAITVGLAQSSSKIGEVSQQVGQHQNEIIELNGKLHVIEVVMRRIAQIKTQVADATTSSSVDQPRSTSRGASLANPHVHQFDMSIPMPSGALAHQNFQHEIDYWMVSRMLPSGERFVKVQPYGTNSLGIKVHSIDDGMDYILIPQGGWMEALGSR